MGGNRPSHPATFAATWDADREALGLVCPECGARPGGFCVSSSGTSRPNMHASRFLPIRRAFAEGRLVGNGEGYRDGREGRAYAGEKRAYVPPAGVVRA